MKPRKGPRKGVCSKRRFLRTRRNQSKKAAGGGIYGYASMFWMTCWSKDCLWVCGFVGSIFPVFVKLKVFVSQYIICPEHSVGFILMNLQYSKKSWCLNTQAKTDILRSISPTIVRGTCRRETVQSWGMTWPQVTNFLRKKNSSSVRSFLVCRFVIYIYYIILYIYWVRNLIRGNILDARWSAYLYDEGWYLFEVSALFAKSIEY